MDLGLWSHPKDLCVESALTKFDSGGNLGARAKPSTRLSPVWWTRSIELNLALESKVSATCICRSMALAPRHLFSSCIWPVSRAHLFTQVHAALRATKSDSQCENYARDFCCKWNWIIGHKLGIGIGRHSLLYVYMSFGSARACVLVCAVHACMRACVHAPCVRACVRACVCG